MTDRDNFWDIGFGFRSKLFEEMDKEFAEVEERLNGMFKAFRENPAELAASLPNSIYYGYQVTVGPDGKPHVREFGNTRPSPKGLVEKSEVREPLVDTVVDEKEKILRITAEMPGVSKQDIKVSVAGKNVTIRAENGGKKYHTDIPVQTALDGKSVKATYTNGILELQIKIKDAPGKDKRADISVE